MRALRHVLEETHELIAIPQQQIAHGAEIAPARVGRIEGDIQDHALQQRLGV